MEDRSGLHPLAPPPRPVPAGLRARLLANTGTLFGALLFGAGSVLAVLVVLGSNPVGDLATRAGTAKAPGRLVAVEEMHYEENKSKVLRYRYLFRTPDGVEHSGRSYKAQRRLASRPHAALGGLNNQPVVTVEYSPGHPEASRIKGFRVRPVSLPFVALLLSPTLIGLLILGTSLAHGRGRIRLLSRGLPARATLVSCKLAGNAEAKEQPFAEFRDAWLSEPRGEAAR